MTDETNPQDFKNRMENDHSHIKGWGIDADRDNDPTYPIKTRTDEEQEGYSWERPPLQPVNEEVLKSVERPNVTAVFGTASPPAGLSGRIRRYAYRYSESSYGRWIPLIMADRVGMVEGIISDIKKGHFPNIIKERGWTGLWKYSRGSLIRKVAISGLITAGAITLIVLRNKRKNKVAVT
ncbi:MAG TPA: hypothetical protein VK212_05870 [Lentimicrobium sp.]|nr:hypothetical protein [Lentimicrobium sp.]